MQFYSHAAIPRPCSRLVRHLHTGSSACAARISGTRGRGRDPLVPVLLFVRKGAHAAVGEAVEDRSEPVRQTTSLERLEKGREGPERWTLEEGKLWPFYDVIIEMMTMMRLSSVLVVMKTV